jgi:hypothetical protein
MSNSKWLNNLGRIIRVFEKDGVTVKKHFMVFERPKAKDGSYIGESNFPLTINEGDYFQLKPQNENLAGLVKQGKLTQEMADKIYNSVRFEISKAPVVDRATTNTEIQTPAPAAVTKKNDGGVNF